MAILKAADLGSILKHDDRILFLLATTLEFVAAGLLIFRSSGGAGWSLALGIGIIFAVYSWFDDTPLCRCLGTLRDIDRNERYLLALLITACATAGLALNALIRVNSTSTLVRTNE
jgi:hypothetical protein